MVLQDVYNGQCVLVTGHTGFKGTWMCHVLCDAGAKVIGYSDREFGFFNDSKIGSQMTSIIGDIRDLDHLKHVFDEYNPEIVIHMAAQPIVRVGYREPVDTYSVNVMGTVNILECVRTTPSVKSFINVTTDKVYLNKEWCWGFRENEELNGYDPYSNSKSCSELVTSSYKNSFFAIPSSGLNMNYVASFDESGKRYCAISTCRAGNVIGGGDFAEDRIIPDCVRAAVSGNDMIIRNPYSTRPYQHVLEPACTYLVLAMKQWNNPEIAGAYNIGPDECDCLSTGKLVTLFSEKWKVETGKTLNVKLNTSSEGQPHEANFLKLDCSKIKTTIGWKPRWSMDECMSYLVKWYALWSEGDDIGELTFSQVREFLNQ